MRHDRALLLASILLLASPSAARDQPAGTPEAEIGLAKGSVFEVLVPDPVMPETSEPGDKPSPDPEFEGSPPRVPHAVEEFLPITRADNLCVDCHAVAEAEEGDPTPLPASHYTDLRRAPERVGDSLAGARWVCLGCHVPLSGAEPLVGNEFAEPAAAATAEEAP